MAGRHAGQERRGLQVPSRADMSARSTCTSWTQPHTLWHLSAQGGESKTKSNQVSGRHEWQKRVKARERRTKRRTDTIGTREEGCKVARGECKACRKTKAGLGLSRHAWRKHVANGKGKERLEQGRCLQTRTPQATNESVVYRKAQGKRNLNQSTMFRVDCETSLRRL